MSIITNLHQHFCLAHIHNIPSILREYSRLFVVFLLLMSTTAYSQDFTPEQRSKLANSDAQFNNPISKIDNRFTNDISLLNNRFRIDYQVKEVTMVFFREYGSAPIVLVQPDGAKLFQYTADGDKVTWFDSPTYDMINIKDPMPGPWQALGDVMSDSRIMVISNLSLVTNALPDELFSGEIIKMKSYLVNDGQPMTFAPFAEAIRLTVNLVSTNNPDENNFGSRTQTIAVFEDNGLGLDEKPKDGIFTGQFTLDVPDGEWQAQSKIETPMYSREKLDPTLRVYPSPIAFTLTRDPSELGDGMHFVTFSQTIKKFDPSSLLIDGEVRLPNGQSQAFSLNQQTMLAKRIAIDNVGPGVYRVKVMAYARTLSGRDVVINVPEYSFTIEPIVEVIPPPSPEELALAKIKLDEALQRQQAAEDQRILEKGLIINGIIFGLGVLVMLGVRLWLNVNAKKQLTPIITSKKGELDDQDLIIDEKITLKDRLISKIKGLLPNKQAA